jgi:hypothetical protein
MRRSTADECIHVFANLSGQPALLPPMALRALYSQGWDQADSRLAGHGCLFAAS